MACTWAGCCCKKQERSCRCRIMLNRPHCGGLDSPKHTGHGSQPGQTSRLPRVRLLPLPHLDFGVAQPARPPKVRAVEQLLELPRRRRLLRCGHHERRDTVGGVTLSGGGACQCSAPSAQAATRTQQLPQRAHHHHTPVQHIPSSLLFSRLNEQQCRQPTCSHYMGPQHPGGRIQPVGLPRRVRVAQLHQRSAHRLPSEVSYPALAAHAARLDTEPAAGPTNGGGGH